MSESPKTFMTPLDHMCLAMNGIVQAARVAGMIDDDDYEKLHHAIWSTSLKQTPRTVIPKENLPEEVADDAAS